MYNFYREYNQFITFNDLKLIKSNTPLNEQKWELKLDLLQMVCKNNTIIIDVGWYPDHDINGTFRIKIIENSNWSNPLLVKETKDFIELEEILRDLAITYCDVLVK